MEIKKVDSLYCMILYIDTNIVIDAVENRKNVFGKNVGSAAADLFIRAAGCAYFLVISDWMLEELAKYKPVSSMTAFFAFIGRKVIRVPYSEEEKRMAKMRNPLHFQDELHGLIAMREKADFLVTRNKIDFMHLRMPVRRPEELT
ncbi:MAG: hypothetical protein ABIA93_00940 [Candidatus Woesearchaeota archaeon]